MSKARGQKAGKSKAINPETIGGLICVAFSISSIVLTFRIPLSSSPSETFFSARTFPLFLSVTLLLVSFYHVVTSTNKRVENPTLQGWRKYDWRRAVSLVLLMIGYALTFDFLGFVVGTFAMLFLGFWIMGERRPIRALVIAVSIVSFAWVVLTQLLDLYLESGTVLREILG